jgi:hypothetical protein
MPTCTSACRFSSHCLHPTALSCILLCFCRVFAVWFLSLHSALLGLCCAPIVGAAACPVSLAARLVQLATLKSLFFVSWRTSDATHARHAPQAGKGPRAVGPSPTPGGGKGLLSKGPSPTSPTPVGGGGKGLLVPSPTGAPTIAQATGGGKGLMGQGGKGLLRPPGPTGACIQVCVVVWCDFARVCEEVGGWVEGGKL